MTVVSMDYGCVVVTGCGSIQNHGRAIDLDSTTAVSISPPLAVSSVAIRLRFPASVPANTNLRLRISFGGALSLGLVNNSAVNTFVGTSNTVQESTNLGSLLNLSTLNGNEMSINIPVASSFTDFEIRTGSLLSVNVAYSLNLLYATAATVAPLPVELVSFTGKTTAAGVELAWTTASEHNSAYFEVERATDSASSAFKPIAQLPGAGSRLGRTSYQFVDKAPAELAYYRLRQVDLDGTATYSPVVAVHATPSVTPEAYPNPTTQGLTITGAAGRPYTLANHLGQTVASGKLPLANSGQLDLGSLPVGVYLLRFSAAERPLKVVKIAGL